MTSLFGIVSPPRIRGGIRKVSGGPPRVRGGISVGFRADRLADPRWGGGGGLRKIVRGVERAGEKKIWTVV